MNRAFRARKLFNCGEYLLSNNCKNDSPEAFARAWNKAAAFFVAGALVLNVADKQGWLDSVKKEFDLLSEHSSSDEPASRPVSNVFVTQEFEP